MKIVRDNCKGCNSSCEHAGKDREFVCVKGVSCKTVKPKPEMVAVIRCRDCVHDGLVTCPIYHIKKHDPDFSVRMVNVGE